MPHGYEYSNNDNNIQFIYNIWVSPKNGVKSSIIFFWKFFFGGILLLFGGRCREAVNLDWRLITTRLHRITCGVARLGFLNPFLNFDHLEWFPAVKSGGEGWSGWPMDVANFSSWFQNYHFVQKLEFYRDEWQKCCQIEIWRKERLARRKFKKT